MTFRIILEQPPAGVDIGLQKGKGHAYETVQTQRSTGADLVFEFTTPAKLGGPFVQGPPAARFVYLDIGTAAGQVGSIWTRRLKIPLTGLPEGVDSVETFVPGKARDGGPNCGTVKPFAGWRATGPRPNPVP
ncbi:MAG: hypothetical protein K2X03_12560 [Bryobacteraceae bacterium]|nr:hypothetical protein [Bryobacteraceae bacterium]